MSYYVTIRGASEIAGVSRRTIYNWIKKKLVDIKFTPSGKIMIDSKSLALRDNKNVHEKCN